MLDEIFSLLSPSEQLGLMTTSGKFHRLLSRLFYRALVLDGRKIRACLTSLSSDHPLCCSYALHVRHLTFQSWNDLHDDLTVPLLCKVLTRTSGLLELRIRAAQTTMYFIAKLLRLDKVFLRKPHSEKDDVSALVPTTSDLSPRAIHLPHLRSLTFLYTRTPLDIASGRMIQELTITAYLNQKEVGNLIRVFSREQGRHCMRVLRLRLRSNVRLGCTIFSLASSFPHIRRLSIHQAQADPSVSICLNTFDSVQYAYLVSLLFQN